MTQLDLFDNTDFTQQNPLTGRRVGFLGSFKNRAALIRKVKEFGASSKSNNHLTRDTQILVLGGDVKQQDLNRLQCYEHDGWKPLKISEADIHQIFNGHYSGYETPPVMKKQVSLDMTYYYWTPPVFTKTKDDEDSGVRCSSPLIYGEENPIYGLEIYIPSRPGVDMSLIRQIIGNFGGYANTEYNDETNVVMLSEESLTLLKQGVKDNVIKQIEAQYNESDAKVFNIQFTCESEFISWVKSRLEKFPDTGTISLLERYLG